MEVLDVKPVPWLAVREAGGRSREAQDFIADLGRKLQAERDAVAF
jgi:hypothetical protein